MSTYKLTYKQFGEFAILIEWPAQVDETILYDVLLFKQKIQNFESKYISEVRSAYHTLLVVYDDSMPPFLTELEMLKKIYNSELKYKSVPSQLWKIPVCYDDDFALDIDDMAQSKNISKNEIVLLHSKAIYTVYFIGFLPGFLYLGGLHKKLFTPRKKTPRMQIEKGAVAIGGNQTGVYPSESPGGWNIIGNSPIDFFKPKNEIPCFVKAGDRIQFYPVSLKEYHNIKTLVNAGVYQMESEVLDD